MTSRVIGMNASLEPLREAAVAALNGLADPITGQGLVASGRLGGLDIAHGRITCVIEVSAGEAPRFAEVCDAAEKALADLPGVSRAQVVLTAPADRSAPPRRAAQISGDPKAESGGLPPARRLPSVRRALAVASGKGGVGKSTVAVNLACAFARLGLKTGLLDADIYGPSAPRMLGLSESPAFVDGKLEPLEAHGIEAMSIGLLVPEDAAMIWRGPMASQALRQMLQEVRWGGSEGLDMLVIDMPPGTGDIHLTLAQTLAVDGAVIVSTPSEVALADARRAHAMFAKMRPAVPVLGLVENMAFFPDPATGAPIPIFGHGAARDEAGRLGVPFLGEIPIDMALRAGGDQGAPLAATSPRSDAAERFVAIAKGLMART